MAQDATQASQGLLQDIPQFPISSVPYTFGSPEYQQAILPYLDQGLQNQAQRAANSRGIFYSGPALADEQQAASNLAYQMAQEGAQQTLSNQQLQQQEAAQQALQTQSLGAQSNMANEQAKASELSGGLSGLGNIGGMYMMNHMFGNGGIPATVPLGTVQDATSVANGAIPASTPVGQGVANLGPETWGNTPLLESDTSMPMFDNGLASASTPLDLGAGLGGGMLGYQIGGGSKSRPGSILGGIGGGALGDLAANMFFPGAGMLPSFLGAGLGAGLGRQFGNLFNGLHL